jgi:hypothetical protein
MKIPLKYGLIAAFALIAWVLTLHWLIPNPQSTLHTLGAPVFFNLIHFAVIYLGLKQLERDRGDKPRFKEALVTGVGIAFVYALTAALFFVVVVLSVGTRWMAGGAVPATTPTRTLLVQAFAGLFVGTMIFGLIYSTLIAFFIAKRQSDLSS